MAFSSAAWRTSAAALARAFHLGELDPRDVLDVVLARHAATHPQLNASVLVDEAGARNAAAQSAERWRRGKPLSRLDGVPVTVKDNIPVRGLPCSWGSLLFADRIATGDDIAPDPSKLSGLSARMLAREPLLAITERLCGPVDRVEQRIGAVLADGPLVEALGVDPGEPLMRVDRWFLGGGHVRQFSIAHYRADCFVITTAEEMTDRKSPRSARWQIEMRIADRD